MDRPGLFNPGIDETAVRRRPRSNPLDQNSETEKPRAPKRIRLFGREMPLPRSRLLRVVVGVALVLMGMVGFLPVVGFWMIPLGILVLSYDIAPIRRLRRRFETRGRRRDKSRRATN